VFLLALKKHPRAFTLLAHASRDTTQNPLSKLFFISSTSVTASGLSAFGAFDAKRKGENDRLLRTERNARELRMIGVLEMVDSSEKKHRSGEVTLATSPCAIKTTLSSKPRPRMSSVV
jgi:hypothetical protein